MAHNPGWLINKHPKDLKAQIKELTSKGYVVTVQDQTTAQLVRRKQFSCLVAALSFFFFGIGFLLYLFFYLAQSDDTIYLDLSTQEYDPNWNKKTKKSYKKLVMGFVYAFGLFLLICVISSFFRSNDATIQDTTPTVSYEIAFEQPGSQSVIQAIAIAPEDATEEKIKTLVETLRKEHAVSSIVRISIFTDKEMAAHLKDALAGGVPDTISESYDRAYVAQYNKNSNTGLEELQIHLEGLQTESKTINF